MVSCTEGSDNTAVGNAALQQVASGFNNVAIGTAAGSEILSGFGNTIIGYLAGQNLGGSSFYNVCIGNGAGPSADIIESNKLYISNTSGTPLIGGDFSSRVVTIDKILSLAPVNTLPTSAVNGMIAIQGVGAAQHIYCYLNGAWKQLDN